MWFSTSSWFGFLNQAGFFPSKTAHSITFSRLKLLSQAHWEGDTVTCQSAPTAPWRPSTDRGPRDSTATQRTRHQHTEGRGLDTPCTHWREKRCPSSRERQVQLHPYLLTSNTWPHGIFTAITKTIHFAFIVLSQAMKNTKHRSNFIEIRLSDCQITLNWTLSKLGLSLEMGAAGGEAV